MFSVIACSEHVRLKKPAPDIYLLALSMLGDEAQEAVRAFTERSKDA